MGERDEFCVLWRVQGGNREGEEDGAEEGDAFDEAGVRV